MNNDYIITRHIEKSFHIRFVKQIAIAKVNFFGQLFPGRVIRKNQSTYLYAPIDQYADNVATKVPGSACHQHFHEIQLLGKNACDFDIHLTLSYTDRALTTISKDAHTVATYTLSQNLLAMPEEFMAGENRKSKYTKQVLRDTLLTMMKRDPILAISVSAMFKAAYINRSTFYNHYHDAYDLLESIEQQFYDSFVEKMSTIDILRPAQDTIALLFQQIYENRELCRILLGENGDKAFLRRVVSIRRDKHIDEVSRQIQGKPRTLMADMYDFFIFGCIGLTQKWVASDFKDSPQQMATLCRKLFISLVDGMKTA